MTASTPPTQCVYPDSDGRPMSDNTLQFRWIVTIKENLEILFRDRDDVFVAGNLLWYAVEGRPRLRAAPDAMVVFGRPKGDRGSYRQWEEGGVAPQVAFEFVSPGNRPGELIRKFNFYQRFGVEEYYLYDPDVGRLDGWQRGRRRFARVRSFADYRSPRLGIRFEPVPDGQMRVFYPDGRPFLTPVEMAAERDAERRRADTAEARAAAAEARLDAEAERNRRLVEKLRELGVEPPA